MVLIFLPAGKFDTWLPVAYSRRICKEGPMDHKKKIAVIDFGGQYAHLLASRIRRLGAYSEIVAPSIKLEEIKEKYSGLVYSGGPSSVYDDGSPRSDPALLHSGIPILGICYGHQLIMQQMGGRVHRGNPEYGPASLSILQSSGIFAGEKTGEENQVWMSHGDEVDSLPQGFEAVAETSDCKYAGVADISRRIFCVQFHPEVNDTSHGDSYLKNFIQICGLEGSWSLDDYIEKETEILKKQSEGRKIFFLISGGVDSTVAYTLLARAVKSDRLEGLLIDTGLMRDREVDEVKAALRAAGVSLRVHRVEDVFLDRLRGVHEPEEKRKIIGETFLDVQEEDSKNLSTAEWLLGQGTIYPDTIESGGTAHSHKIKTHHNRVGRVQELIERGLIIEPIRDLYKDEVRRLGKLLGLPDSLVFRHPFPGPGLGVRCLCLPEGQSSVKSNDSSFYSLCETSGNTEITGDMKEKKISAFVLPVQSVGVQGDQRSYAHPAVLASDKFPGWDSLIELSRKIPNKIRELNRVLYLAASKYPWKNTDSSTKPGSFLTRPRLDMLRRADRIVHDFQQEKKIYEDIWQFPVVLIPVYLRSGNESESIILRPVHSLDAMTASVYRMNIELVEELCERILEIDGISSVFYDLTSKPPGTIEWE